jgi:hypothetical protein
MSSNLPKSSPAVDEAVSTAVTHEQLRENLINGMVAEGCVIQTRDSDHNRKLIIRQTEPQPTPAVALPATPATCVRTIYPAGNNRFEIYGTSEAELDEKERQIRSLF